MLRIKGFTLLEVMFAAAVLVGLLVGLMSVYIYCFDLQETARNISFALQQTRTQLEQIRDLDFAQIPTQQNLAGVPLNGMNGRIRIEVSDCIFPSGAVAQNCNLYNIRVVTGWVQKGGRIIGEGQIDKSGNFFFSDSDGDGQIESPVQIETALARKHQ